MSSEELVGTLRMRGIADWQQKSRRAENDSAAARYDSGLGEKKFSGFRRLISPKNNAFQQSLNFSYQLSKAEGCEVCREYLPPA